MSDLTIQLDEQIHGNPGWLTPMGKVDRVAIHRKHRDRWLAKHPPKHKDAKPETMARLRAVMHRIERMTLMQSVSVWNNAIAMLDRSEPAIRDVIERDLSNFAGLSGIKLGSAIRKGNKVSKKVCKIRARAVKAAFRYLRFELKNPEIKGRSLAQWASWIAATDQKVVDNAIKIGLTGGLDNTEIARKVIGSLELRGADGATEVTRQHIIRIGRAAIKPLIHRRTRGISR
jgi:hypothetical protein